MANLQKGEIDEIWPGYLATGYLDERGFPRRELFDPETIGRFLGRLADAQMTKHQLRRFFGHCRLQEGRLRVQGDAAWPAAVRELARLPGVAAAAVARNNAPPIFAEFIARNVRAVGTDRAAFERGMMPHFETIVGFAEGTLKTTKGGDR